MLIVAMLLPTLVTFAYFRLADGAPSSVQQAVYAVGKVVQFALPVVWVGIVCGQRLGFVRPTRKGLVAGLAFGATIFAATWFGYALWLREAAFFAPAAEGIRHKVEGLGLASPGAFVLLGIFYAVCHSLLEEYYWRWFVFGRLGHWVPVGWAIGLSAVGFMAHHVLVLDLYFHETPLATLFFSLCVMMGGVFWAWLYQRTGSLFGPWMSHAIVDAAIFAVGYGILFP
jgi:membrane protease YdiL (CAAX protease family)